MKHYIILFKQTGEGMLTTQGAPERVKRVKKVFGDLGVEVKAFYVLMGRYDTMFIVKAADDKTVAKAVFALRSLGKVSSETLPALTEDEFEEVCKNWPDFSAYFK